MAATPDDLSDADLDSIGAQPAPAEGGSFSTWFQQHQRGILIIGAVTLGLTVLLLFRRSSGSTAASSGQPAQPGMTTDTASALNQQQTLLEAMANAIAQLQKQQQPGTNPPPIPPPGPNPGGTPTPSTGLLAYLATLPAAAQQQIRTYFAGLSSQQQQMFLSESLSTQEAQIQQFLSVNQSSSTPPTVPNSTVQVGQVPPPNPLPDSNNPGKWPNLPSMAGTPYSAPPAAA